MRTVAIKFENTTCSTKDIMGVVKSFERANVGKVFIARFHEILLQCDETRQYLDHVESNSMEEFLTKVINEIVLHGRDSDMWFDNLSDTIVGSKKPGLLVPQRQFDCWKTCLIQTVSEFDEFITAQLLSQWNKVINKGVKFVAPGHEK